MNRPLGSTQRRTRNGNCYAKHISFVQLGAAPKSQEFESPRRCNAKTYLCK